MLTLSGMVSLWESVQQDDELANYWFREAASQSDTATRIQLGTLRMSCQEMMAHDNQETA